MESVSDVFKVLSHPLRVDILRSVEEGDKRYTDVLEELDVETGKLNFHLRKLDGYLEKEGDTYRLTERGFEALETVQRAHSVKEAAATAWRKRARQATPRQRLKAFAVDAAVFVGTPFVASLIVLLSIPVQLSAEQPFLYLMAAWNPAEHLLTGSLLLFGATALGESYTGHSLGAGVVGLKVERNHGRPTLPVAAARAFATTYLLPLDFLLARALDPGEFRLTDSLLDLEVIRDQSGPGEEGAGGWTSDSPAPEAEGTI